VGRYAGVVGVLAAWLAEDGVAVAGTAAVDAGDDVGGCLAGAGSAVVTAAPGDPTAEVALAVLAPQRVVAVTWHPADERAGLPAGTRVVEAGRIRADLAAAVQAAQGAAAR
jgi:hypothetical protein